VLILPEGEMVMPGDNLTINVAVKSNAMNVGLRLLSVGVEQ
jgi:translation elongation factor EF-Tu-like GTPase